MINKLFVYGTLMNGCSNHDIIQGDAIEYISKALVKNMKLYMHNSLSFPAMIPGEGVVHGEIISIKEDMVSEVLSKTDFLEGFIEHGNPDNFYDRVEDSCMLSDGSEELAYIYLYNGPRRSLVGPLTNGVYKEFIDYKQQEEKR